MFSNCVKNATGEGELENDYLVMINIDDLKIDMNKWLGKTIVSCSVSNTETIDHEIRDINIPAYEWGFLQSDIF